MVTDDGADTNAAFKSCVLFVKCTAHINHE